jgi:phosphoglycerate dehydrogenase-like enzyme
VVSKKPTLLLVSGGGMNRDDLLVEKLTTDWDVQIWPRDGDVADYDRHMAKADAVVCGHVPPIPKGAPLKLFQVPFTGYDYLKPNMLPKAAVLCNTHEHETTIAEYIMLGMLEWQIALMRETDPMMRASSYNGRNINRGPHHRELRGCTVGIVGYGHIGREVARRWKGFDMKVMAVSRTIRDEGNLVDWYGTVDQMDELLEQSDFVIVCAPLAENTRGLINAESFRRMKSDAIICNVGRGSVIDEAALYEALASKRIRGGILDVWYTYPSDDEPNPWPSRFPFQKLDNAILSPHNSAWTAEMSDRRWSFVATNLDRLARGEQLSNFCFQGERED